jgi:hypothetical protein
MAGEGPRAKSQTPISLLLAVRPWASDFPPTPQRSSRRKGEARRKEKLKELGPVPSYLVVGFLIYAVQALLSLGLWNGIPAGDFSMGRPGRVLFGACVGLGMTRMGRWWGLQSCWGL